MAGFDGWLSKKLLQINPDVDLEVFVSYIRSIVESEENVEEATDALDGILGEIVVRQRCTSLRVILFSKVYLVTTSINSLVKQVRFKYDCFT